MLQYKPPIYIIGGAALTLMGLLMIKTRENSIKIETSRLNSSLLGGIFYTAFNPTQPPWWTSAGLALLLQGYELMGNPGIVTVTAGHWLADLAYYSLVSHLICRYGKFFIPRQRQITLILGAFVILLGACFTLNGLISS